MKYIVAARDWDNDLKARFGESESIHELSDAEVIECIKQFGRATIDKIEPYGAAYIFKSVGMVIKLSEQCDWFIFFENTYD